MPNSIYQKFIKREIDIFFSLMGIILLSPVFLILGILIKTDSPGPAIFKQKRVGKDGKIFTMYKFRSMVKEAEKLKKKYLHLNEADGPVFKIKNDPRYTRMGKYLSHTGMDELPQLLNILRGEMSLVGHRPLPVDEEAMIPKKCQAIRLRVRPGLVSSWLIRGNHSLTFDEWMKLDLQDIKKSSCSYDLAIFRQTILMVFSLLKNKLDPKK